MRLGSPKATVFSTDGHLKSELPARHPHHAGASCYAGYHASSTCVATRRPLHGQRGLLRRRTKAGEHALAPRAQQRLRNSSARVAWQCPHHHAGVQFQQRCSKFGCTGTTHPRDFVGWALRVSTPSIAGVRGGGKCRPPDRLIAAHAHRHIHCAWGQLADMQMCASVCGHVVVRVGRLPALTPTRHQCASCHDNSVQIEPYL